MAPPNKTSRFFDPPRIRLINASNFLIIEVMDSPDNIIYTGVALVASLVTFFGNDAGSVYDIEAVRGGQLPPGVSLPPGPPPPAP